MEILTLLKANIRYKKGAFISTVLLVFIITAVSLSLLSVVKNYNSGVEKVHEYADSPDIAILSDDSHTSGEDIAKLDGCSAVERYKVFRGVCPLGMRIDDKMFGASLLMAEMPENARLFNDRCTDIAGKAPELKKGEAYLPIGITSQLDLSVGDRFEIIFERDEDPDDDIEPRGYGFTLKGVVEEPMIGSASIGIKLAYMSKEDLEFYTDLCRSTYNNEYDCFTGMMVYAYKNDSSMSQNDFTRAIELDTHLISGGLGLSLSKDDSIRYTGLYTVILSGAMLGFTALLFIVVLIVIGHSIKSELEIDFVNLGILKSQGWTDKSLNLVFMLRYMTAEVLAIILGVAASIPLERIISNIFIPITGIVPDRSFDYLRGMLVIIAIIVFSVLIIFLSTRKIAKISPMKAISGGSDNVSGGSTLDAPIAKKTLSLSLAFRSFTSAKKRYVGIILITTLLTFFVFTVNVLAGCIKSRNTLKAMGFIMTDIDFFIDEDKRDSIKVEDVEEVIEKYTKITEKNYIYSGYFSINGYTLNGTVIQQPETINGMLEGKLPMNDDELIITKMAAGAYGIDIGDTVTVATNGKEADYKVTGFFQTMNDAGMSFDMNLEAARKLGIEEPEMYGVYIDDISRGDEIVEDIRDTFGNGVTASFYNFEEESENLSELYNLAVFAVRALIYIFSAIFAFVAVLLVCSKTFTQERKDYGIYKSLGFTTGKLRRQFALRFTIVSFIGGIFGSVLGVLLSGKVIEFVFSMIGISKMTIEYTASLFISSVSFILVCVLIFSFVVSRKIKRVSVRELVTE